MGPTVTWKHGLTWVFCLHQDTLIRTADEQFLPVWQITPGERLYGGGETYSRVMSRQHVGPLLRLTIQGNPDPLLVTKEHRIVRIPGRVGGRQDSRTSEELWQKRETVPASLLQRGDYVLVPLGGVEHPVTWQWHERLQPRGTRQRHVDFRPDDRLYRLLGYYVAEGCIGWKHGIPQRVQLTFGRHEGTHLCC